MSKNGKLVVPKKTAVKKTPAPRKLKGEKKPKAVRASKKTPLEPAPFSPPGLEQKRYELIPGDPTSPLFSSWKGTATALHTMQMFIFWDSFTAPERTSILDTAQQIFKRKGKSVSHIRKKVAEEMHAQRKDKENRDPEAPEIPEFFMTSPCKKFPGLLPPTQERNHPMFENEEEEIAALRALKGPRMSKSPRLDLPMSYNLSTYEGNLGEDPEEDAKFDEFLSSL